MGKFNPSEQELNRAFESNANGINYNGTGDLAIDFGTASNWGGEPTSKREYGFSIENTSENDVTIALCAASNVDAAKVKDNLGEPVSAILTEGTLLEGVTAKGNPKSIALFQQFVKNHPTRIHTMKFQVSDPDMLANPVYFKNESPFAGAGEFDQFTPASFTDENTQQENRATCDLQSIDFQFNCDRIIVYKVPAKSKVSISMLVGAIANDCLELSRKAAYGRVGSIQE